MEKGRWKEDIYKTVFIFFPSHSQNIPFPNKETFDIIEGSHFLPAFHDLYGRICKQCSWLCFPPDQLHLLTLFPLCVTMVTLAFLVFLQLIKLIPNKKPLYLLFFCLECFSPRPSDNWYCLITQIQLQCYCFIWPFKINNPPNSSAPLCTLLSLYTLHDT